MLSRSQKIEEPRVIGDIAATTQPKLEKRHKSFDRSPRSQPMPKDQKLMRAESSEQRQPHYLERIVQAANEPSRLVKKGKPDFDHPCQNV